MSTKQERIHAIAVELEKLCRKSCPERKNARPVSSRTVGLVRAAARDAKGPKLSAAQESLLASIARNEPHAATTAGNARSAKVLLEKGLILERKNPDLNRESRYMLAIGGARATKAKATKTVTRKQLLTAIAHVDQEGRHTGLVPFGALRKKLGITKPALRKALEAAERDFDVDLRLANDPSRIRDKEEAFQGKRGEWYEHVHARSDT